MLIFRGVIFKHHPWYTANNPGPNWSLSSTIPHLASPQCWTFSHRRSSLQPGLCEKKSACILDFGLSKCKDSAGNQQCLEISSNAKNGLFWGWSMYRIPDSNGQSMVRRFLGKDTGYTLQNHMHCILPRQICHAEKQPIVQMFSISTKSWGFRLQYVRCGISFQVLLYSGWNRVHHLLC